MGLKAGITQSLAEQRGRMIGWVPVCLACGIGIYFSLRFEPPIAWLLVLAVAAAIIWHAARHLPEEFAPLAMGAALICAGVLLGAGRSHWVAGPSLSWRYYGPIEGRIIAIDRSQSGALRLTLDQVALARVSPARTPQRVRVSLHGERGGDIAITPGLRVMTTGHLSPPSGPVEPGGFDFQRHAWFARLGAVGYSRVPLLGSAPAAQGASGLGVLRLRMAASAHIQSRLPGDIGGFASAITTGDRSAISQGALEALRASNLAHLLAISGLHMGLLSAVVFGGLRVVLAAVPFAALHLPTRSLAAAGALAVAAGYLALSGGNVATERAFIMVAVALVALMLGRRAISLRAVAIAAILVLMLRPEALMGPGFQMSFAATTALVAVFGWLRDAPRLPFARRMPRWLRPVAAVFMSSLVAGLATAPIAAAHFNLIAHYGLIANLSSVPLMGLLVMPAGVAALLLYPIGLDGIALWLMGQGLAWILAVAQTVSAWEGARGTVIGPGPWVLPLLALGFLTLVLWQGRGRFAGLALMAGAFVLWQGAARPQVLIADNGSLVGVMTPQGRALSKPRGAGFIASNWLENDGDKADQPAAAARWDSTQIIHISGKRAAADFTGCVPGQIVVASVPLAGGDCLMLDPEKLRLTGAVAVDFHASGAQIKTARAMSGERLWSQWPAQQADLPLHLALKP
ncbi:MAG: ComEC/Rec2 family competence protein [Sulfitobacter sp.]